MKHLLIHHPSARSVGLLAALLLMLLVPVSLTVAADLSTSAKHIMPFITQAPDLYPGVYDWG